MAAPVARKEGHRDTFQRADADTVAWCPKRRLYPHLVNVGQSVHRIQTATADDPNLRLRLRHRIALHTMLPVAATLNSVYTSTPSMTSSGETSGPAAPSSSGSDADSRS